VATPAHVAAQLLAPVDDEIARDLSQISYAGCVIVCLGYRRDQFSTPPDCVGFVVPAIENRQILAASFSSCKFSGRAPRDHVLARVFIGGACQADLLACSDDQLIEIAQAELAVLSGVNRQPLLRHVARWPQSMPQYHLGHLQLVERIERRAEQLGGLQLIGNAYHGVGIPHCIHAAEQAVDRIAQHL